MVEDDDMALKGQIIAGASKPVRVLEGTDARSGFLGRERETWPPAWIGRE